MKNKGINRSYIHVINKFGEKKKISRTEFMKQSESVNESDNSLYEFDVDWYLKNGCVTLDRLIEKIENGE